MHQIHGKFPLCSEIIRILYKQINSLVNNYSCISLNNTLHILNKVNKTWNNKLNWKQQREIYYPCLRKANQPNQLHVAIAKPTSTFLPGQHHPWIFHVHVPPMLLHNSHFDVLVLMDLHHKKQAKPTCPFLL
jgi:hypothetical protein